MSKSMHPDIEGLCLHRLACVEKESSSMTGTEAVGDVRGTVVFPECICDLR